MPTLTDTTLTIRCPHLHGRHRVQINDRALGMGGSSVVTAPTQCAPECRSTSAPAATA
jgi:hypothetical protein